MSEQTGIYPKGFFKCENNPGEYDGVVFVTKRIFRYVAEQNWHSMPPELLVAERGL